MSEKKEETLKVPSKGGETEKEGAEEKKRVQKKGEEKAPELVGGRGPRCRRAGRGRRRGPPRCPVTAG